MMKQIRDNSKLKYFSILFIITIFCNGCLIPHLVNSASKSGMTESGRQVLLNERVKEFGNSLYWGEVPAALVLVHPNKKSEFAKQLFDAKKLEERVVQSDIESINFKNNAYNAVVFFKIRSYRAPFYTVTDRLEQQAWEYSMSDGWQLVERMPDVPMEDMAKYIE